MTFDLAAKYMSILKRSGYYWMNDKTLARYPKLCANIWLISLTFF